MAQAVQAGGQRQNRGFILGWLTFGHGVAHLYDLGFPVFLTEIAKTFSLTTFQTGILLGHPRQRKRAGQHGRGRAG